MTYCSVYIGDLADPEFQINQSGPPGNIPRALSKSFPPVDAHYNALFHKWAKDKQIFCTETDTGAWVAKVRKEQILDYADYAYGSSPSYTDPAHMLMSEGRPYLVDKLEVIRTFISGLEEQKLYALVAECN